MATDNSKCKLCDQPLGTTPTLVHTQRHDGIWDEDCSMCAGCFKQVKAWLDKVQSQKSWKGLTASDVDALNKKCDSQKQELQFLRLKDADADELMVNDAQLEVVMINTEGCQPIHALRNILMSRSPEFKKALTSEDYKKLRPPGRLFLSRVKMQQASFRAVINFLNTAELSPEVLRDHAGVLMTAGSDYKIEMLTAKCEDFMIKNMAQDPETTLKYLVVGHQCKSDAIQAAAWKQINNSKLDLSKLHDDVKAAGVPFLMKLCAPKPEKKPEPPKGPAPAASASRHAVESSFIARGTCTCNVHPFVHGAHFSVSPMFDEFPGLHFNKAFVQQSDVHLVLPPDASQDLGINEGNVRERG